MCDVQDEDLHRSGGRPETPTLLIHQRNVEAEWDCEAALHDHVAEMPRGKTRHMLQ